MCLFWGGLPHQMDDASDDVFYAGAHLPLVHFFRLHLPLDVRHRLMTGATLVTSATDRSDDHNFERWNRYARSGDPAQGAARRERAAAAAGAGAVRTVPPCARCSEQARTSHAPFDQQSSRNVGRMCDFIAENFLYDIDCVDIAAAADIHPKYAMSVFKKSTGMTLNEYVNLLRLSYAQALLMDAGRQGADGGHGQRFRLAQRLQQIVPETRGHVALRFSKDLGERHRLTNTKDCGAICMRLAQESAGAFPRELEQTCIAEALRLGGARRPPAGRTSADVAAEVAFCEPGSVRYACRKRASISQP